MEESKLEYVINETLSKISDKDMWENNHKTNICFHIETIVKQALIEAFGLGQENILDIWNKKLKSEVS